jgi:hypothetical protein
MMSQPSAARLLEVVRKELRDNVLPGIVDPQVTANLQMVLHVLETIGVRVQHEIAWMCEEVGAAQELGASLAEELPSAGALTAALDRLNQAPLVSLHLDDVMARYALGSEVLSCLLEQVPPDHPRRSEVESLLDDRLAHEVAVMGEFALVGRS